MTNKIKRFKILCLASWFLVLFAACTEDLASYVPGNGQEGYFNFYNASEVLTQGNLPGIPFLQEGNMVYINDSVPTVDFPRFPQFTHYIAYPDNRQWPTDNATGTSIFSGSGEVFWLALSGQEAPYRFIFTSLNKTYLQELSFSPLARSFNALYLTESPETDSAYTIVNAPVELDGVQGKVKVQVVNLVPDWEAIDAVLMDKDGNETSSSLPLNVAFGQHGNYTEIDTAMANKHNQIIIKIRKSGETDFRLSVAVTASSGSNYTLVVKGFAYETSRYIKISNSEWLNITVSPSLRVHARRMY